MPEININQNASDVSGYKRKWYHVYNYCALCPHNADAHDMNCMECCPVQRDGVDSGGMYEKQEELARDFKKKVEDLLRS